MGSLRDQSTRRIASSPSVGLGVVIRGPLPVYGAISTNRLVLASIGRKPWLPREPRRRPSARWLAWAPAHWNPPPAARVRAPTLPLRRPTTGHAMTASRQDMLKARSEHTVPQLRALGFKGSLPHFHRVRGDQVDLQTFQFSHWGGRVVAEASFTDKERNDLHPDYRHADA